MPRTALLAIALSAGSALAADDFARLAPPDAALLVCVGNYTQTKDRLLATPLGQLAEAPELADLMEEARKAQMEQFETLATELGIDVEQWPEPDGMVGLATVMTPVEEPEAWGPASTPAFLVGVDFGERIAQIQSIFDAVVDKGLDQGLIEIQTQSVGDVEVITLTPIHHEDDQSQDEPQIDDSSPLSLSGLLKGDTPTTIAIAGSILFISDADTLVVDAVDRWRGADLPCAADDPVVQQALAQHPEGTSDYLVLQPGKLGIADAFFTGMGVYPGSGFDTHQILRDLGVAGIKALSLALHLDSPDAQAEFSLGVLDNDRTGLVSLVDMTDQAWNPPAFTSPDAVAATRLLVDFPRLPEVVREFWSTLPNDLQDEQGFIFEQAMGYIDAIAPLLGPEVYIVQSLNRPFSAVSGGVAYAIPVSDEIPINNLLALGAQSGMKSRQISGATIYDVPPGLIPQSLSVSVAYGHVFVGTTASVENALRLAGAAGADSLADDPAFQDALRPLPSTGNAVQFTRALDIAEFTLWSAQHAREITIAQMRGAGYPEDFITQYAQEQDPTPEWLKNLSIDTLARGIGDVSMEIAPSDDGFRGRILLHAPKR